MFFSKIIREIILIIFIGLILNGCKRPSVTGSEAILSSNHNTLEFKQTLIGENQYEAYTLKNDGETTATDIQIEIIDAPFSLSNNQLTQQVSNICNESLEPGKECQLIFQFNPNSLGEHETIVLIHFSTGVERKTLELCLTANAITPPMAEIESQSGNSIDFGTQIVGQTQSNEITLTNKGNHTANWLLFSPLSSSFKYLGGAFPGTGGNCSYQLEAQQSCNLFIEFTPNVDSLFNDVFVIQYDNGLSTQVVLLNFSGTGTSSALGFLGALDGPSYEFPDTKIDSIATQTINIKNSGGIPITSMTPQALPLPFSYTGGSYPGNLGDCDATLNPTETCQIEIQFAPQVVNDFVDTVMIDYFNGSSNQTFSLPIMGHSLAHEPALLATTTAPTVNFGNVDVGMTEKKIITIENIGDIDATAIAPGTISGSYQYTGSTFPGSNGDCGNSLSVGAQCDIEVVFEPTTGAFFPGTLQLDYNNGSALTALNLILTGVGVSEGQLDTNFNGLGFLTWDNSPAEQVRGLGVDWNDNIVVASSLLPESQDEDFVSYRFLDSGSLDATYGTVGMAHTDMSANSVDQVTAMILQDDDKVLLTGQVDNNIGILRYDTNGQLDTSFSVVGHMLYDLEPIFNDRSTPGTITINNQNEIIIAGNRQGVLNPNESFAIRLQTSGLVDVTGFGLLGVKSWDIVTSLEETITCSAIDASDKIYFAGYAFDSGQYDSFITRLNDNGAVDVSFGTNGLVKLDLSSDLKNDKVFDIKIQSDGKILLIGSEINGSQLDILVHRLNSDGSTDLTFGTAGTTNIDTNSLDNEANTGLIDSAGNIFVAGYANNGADKDAIVAKILPDGTADLSFGYNSVFSFDQSGADDVVTSIDRLSNGSLVLGGYSQAASEQNQLIFLVKP